MSVNQYMIKTYGGKYEAHGNDPKSFLHNDQESQYERFAMLERLFVNETTPFTVHEIGCSLGHLGDYLKGRFPLAVFSGSDIYEPFVEECRQRFPGGEFFCRDIANELPADRYDYVVTCGTYNIPGDSPREDWQAAVYQMAKAMFALSSKGIGMTFLTKYHDPERHRSDLFYQDEHVLMDFAVRNLSRHFELDELGPLYEYALRVYRREYINSRYPQQAFNKYFAKK